MPRLMPATGRSRQYYKKGARLVVLRAKGAERTFLFLPPVLQRQLLLPVSLSLLVHLSPLLLFLL